MDKTLVDYFISYQQRDLAWANWIDETLRGAGYTTLFQARDFKVGDNFVQQMHAAFQCSRQTIAVLSEAYLESFWTMHECQTALARVKSGHRLIPVRVKSVRDLGILAPIAYVDLVGMRKPAARKALCEALQVKTDVPSGPVRFPGAPKRIGAIPFLRNPFFIGRELLLEALGADPASAAAPVYALVGLGGVGKTQVAIEAAHRHAATGGSVFWIGAQDEQSLCAGFAQTAKRLGVALAAENDAGLSDFVAPVVDWLAVNPGWLLVFDNVEAIATVRECLPDCGGGRVLITTRLANLDSLGIVQKLRVDEFTPRDGLVFLQRRTQRDTLNAAESAAASRLVHELAGLPLALEQAAAYVAARGASFRAYLASFEQRRLALLESSTPQASPYAATVGTTWRMNLERIDAESPATGDLLRASAFVAADAIPLRMIVAAARSERFSLAGFFEQVLFAPEDRRHDTVLGTPLKQALGDAGGNPLAAYDLIEPLLRYSLIRLDASSESYAVHRVLQEVVRDAMSADDRALWARRAVEMVHEAMPVTDRIDAEAEALHPHAQAVIAHALELCPDDALLPSLALNLGGDLLARGAYGRARPLLEEAVRLIERVEGGKNSRRLVTALHNLGALYKDIGDYPRAAATLQRAIELRTKQQAKPIELAKSQDALGNLFVHQGRFAEAEALHRRSLATFEAECEPDDVLIATSAQFLAAALGPLGRWDEVRALCQRSLSIYRRAFPAGSQEVATALCNLARSTVDDREAMRYLDEALAIYAAIFGPDHPSIGRASVVAASRKRRLGDIEAAKRLSQDALRILGAAFGADHLELGGAYLSLAELYIMQGRLAEAYGPLEQAQRIYAKHWGPHCMDALQLLGGMVGNLHARGEFEKALPLADALIEGFEQAAPGSNEVGMAWSNRGALLYELRRYGPAREAHTRALAVLEQMAAPPMGDLALTLNNIATALAGEGSMDVAETFFRRAIAVFEEHATDHPMRLTTLRSFAALLRKQGRAEDAAQFDAKIEDLGSAPAA